MYTEHPPLSNASTLNIFHCRLSTACNVFLEVENADAEDPVNIATGEYVLHSGGDSQPLALQPYLDFPLH